MPLEAARNAVYTSIIRANCLGKRSERATGDLELPASEASVAIRNAGAICIQKWSRPIVSVPFCFYGTGEARIKG